MKPVYGVLLCIAATAMLSLQTAAQDETPVSAKAVGTAKFSAPIRLMDGDVGIRTEMPGYAAPCWADVTGDGKKDLLVGQFAGGKIKVYPGLGGGKIGKGQWLKIDGKAAEVPGVW